MIAPRHRAGAGARGLGSIDANVRTVLSPAWTTDVADRRRRRRKLAGLRHRATRTRATATAARCSASQQVACPRCGSIAHRSARRIRLDLLQGAVALHRLPRAVRLFQVSLSRACRAFGRDYPALPRLTVKRPAREASTDAVSLAFACRRTARPPITAFAPGQYLTLRTHDRRGGQCAAPTRSAPAPRTANCGSP